MLPIKSIHAREILDSRGEPTVEAEVTTKNGNFRASVPSGASTGKHEAWELRDGGKRYFGKGVRKAVRNIEQKIAPELIGKDPRQQEAIDKRMIALDGTENKSRLGANALLAVSLACARAGAAAEKLPLYHYFRRLLGKEQGIIMPRLFFNVINGGKHAGNELVFQEFMIAPRTRNVQKSLQMGSEVYHALKRLVEAKYGKQATNVGDEGGFAPPLKKAEEALDILKEAIKRAGYAGKIDLALDCAASSFYREGFYHLPEKMSKEKLLAYYERLIEKYNIISIEDPFEQEDFASFAELRKRTGIQVVGDDLTVTNPKRLAVAIQEQSCSCLLLKVNQIGTLTEALEAVRLAYAAGWKVMVSHRSGETEDDFIADLAVGIGCGQLKAGAPCRGERTAKYNRLLRILDTI
ncbi:phosphopyruvate hydratase [Candidatus Woesearchaeota archaeon]|nr:phosphopyruvate hydratase [Candidatus Woesearchaeota archaeon]